MHPAVDWHDYDAFDWSAARQSPMTAEQRRAVAEMVADLLELSPMAREGACWGRASPPGRFAATVIRLSAGVGHRYQQEMSEIGVKVFKTTEDARREARRIVPFHRECLHRLPGLPNERVQRSLDAGTHTDRHGDERAFVVQEWVVGDTLEDLLRRRWRAHPVDDGGVIRSILGQVLGQIVIPLWGAGTVWWDVRDANYCYDPPTDRLTLIDVDSLGAYADEILRTPQTWLKRDRGRATALARLRQMATRLVLAQRRVSAGKRKAEASIAEAWHAELEPALSVLGREPQEPTAQAALRRFFDRLGSGGLLVTEGACP